jgi:gluconate kinase
MDLTLSPQIVIRDQVRSLWKKRIVRFHASEPVTSWMNLLFCSSLGRDFRPGTWKFRVVDLKRYGRGGLEDMV